MTAFSDKQVEMVFRMFPPKVQPRALELRELILKVADEHNLSDQIKETLKWGEPSYLVPKGSTIRIGWNDSEADYLQLLFHCQTSLVETFRKVFPHLEFESNRAIKVSCSEQLDTKALRKCIELGLTYHSVKQLPLLGTG